MSAAEPSKPKRRGSYRRGARTARKIAADEQRWERVFARHVDPDYYAHDERSLIPSSLGIVGFLPRGVGK